jgi:V/A-type H+-transporting ATPase subunit C
VRLDLANARIGARRPRLVGRDGLLEILARASPEARIDLVRASAAGAAMRPKGAAETEGLLAVEEALRAGLRAEGLELLDQVEGARPRALLAAYLDLEEAEAVKAVVRGLLGGAPVEGVLAAAPATPVLGREVLRTAVASASVEAALGLLAAAGSPAAAAAGTAWAEQARARHALLPVEVAADRAALERAFRAARGRFEDALVLRAHLADRVDARNAATLLALGPGVPDPDPFLPRGRRLAVDDLDGLAASSPEARSAGLAGRLGVPVEALASPTLADLALERAALAPLRREARRRPLSLAVPLWYLAERRAEVRRIALVLRGAELGLPGDDLIALAEA